MIQKLKALFSKKTDRSLLAGEKPGFLKTARAALFNAVIIVLATEMVIRENYFRTQDWLIERPVSVLGSILLTFFLIVTTLAAINRKRAGFTTVYIVSTLFLMINYFKFKYLGQYFYPWDLRSGMELVGIANVFFSSGNQRYALLGLAVLAAVLVFFGVKALKRRKRVVQPPLMPLLPRLGILTLAGCLLYAVIFHNESWIEGNLAKAGIKNYGWNQQMNFKKNGALLCFMLNVNSSFITKPEGYSKERVAQAVQALEAPESSAQAPGVRPNVIVVMSEALWDPTQLKGAGYSEDPLTRIKALDPDQLMSPEFGGLTCNVEFEFLTGMSMRFFPEGAIPYQQYINRPIPSLPSEFKQNGYKTLSIHPYFDWFWNRKQVYRLMGFDQSVYAEQMQHQKKRGLYISDASVVEEIQDAVERTEEPLFVFAVTMQNHGPFADNRYKKTKTLTSAVEDPDRKKMLETYGQGAYEADKAFGQLLDYAAASPEPTIVVLYGDHLPGLGDNYQLYREMGFIRPEADSFNAMTNEERLKMRTTPLAHFSNFSTFQLPKVVSPSMLSSYVMEAAGIENSPYFSLVGALARQYPGIDKEFLVNGDGVVVTEAEEQLISQYEVLQFDQLFGKNYLADVLPKGTPVALAGQ